MLKFYASLAIESTDIINLFSFSLFDASRCILTNDQKICFFFSNKKISQNTVSYCHPSVDFVYPLSSILSPNLFVSPSLGIFYSKIKTNISAYFDTKGILVEGRILTNERKRKIY